MRMWEEKTNKIYERSYTIKRPKINKYIYERKKTILKRVINPQDICPSNEMKNKNKYEKNKQK